MHRKVFTTTIIGSSFVVLLLYFGLTTGEEESYNNNILNPVEIFAQEGDKLPVVKNSKIIEFSGVNYADVVNSRDINLNSFTVSVWFNTAMNVTGEVDNAFLINKGGVGTELPGFNLNYGIWLNNREQVSGGFETLNGDDYFLTSQASYADGMWHNAILTFDNEQNLLNLYMDGLEVATNTTNIGITPDNTGKQPIRLGANSLAEKGKINGNYTGQLDDIQIWDYAFTKEQVANLFDTESNIAR
ncbi:MAG TPA: LamG domain-containing protein [Nitrososphaeraceae archaeon]|nr:LamG domain-containing protein [Nitrososphaeraceae archaeon]